MSYGCLLAVYYIDMQGAKRYAKVVQSSDLSMVQLLFACIQADSTDHFCLPTMIKQTTCRAVLVANIFWMQVLSIVTVAVAFVAMAGSIFGMNLYFNVQSTPPVGAFSKFLLLDTACVPESMQHKLFNLGGSNIRIL